MYITYSYIEITSVKRVIKESVYNRINMCNFNLYIIC